MLRPAASLVHQVDTVILPQCLCLRRLARPLPPNAKCTASHARRSNSSSSTARVGHYDPVMGAAWRRRETQRFDRSGPSIAEALPFLNESNQSRETRIRPDTVDPRRHRQIASLRNDGTSFNSSSSPALGSFRGSRSIAPSSAQTIAQMLPPEDDHGNAVDGTIPETSPLNPAWAKQIRKLQDLANNGTTAEVFMFARSMAAKGYAPTLEAYSCLIQTCADPKAGCSMQQIAMSLLQELKDEGFVPTSNIYHNLLKIFARSPDYLTMEAVLKEMQMERWITPDTEGAQNILLHYLATGQLERALEMFYDRRSKGAKVGYNTYMEIIKALGRVNEVEEAMRIMFEFQKEWGSISGSGLQPMAWYELLNVAASNYHLEGVSYIWRKVVQAPSSQLGSTRNTLNPDDGLCLKVLNTAARHGNPELGLEVFRVLSQRHLAFSEHHFAALIAAYARAEDIPSAFRTLTLMRKQGVEPTATTASAVVDALVASGDIAKVDAAYAALKDFANSASEHEVVEVAAFNAVIAACVRLKDLERALGMFGECVGLEISPTTETFNILFEGCVQCSSVPNKELAMFLASEMKELGLFPDAKTYEELLKTSLYQEEEYDEAFMYLEEMKEVVPQGKVRPMVYEWIARRLDEKKDERLKMVVQEMIEEGYEDYAAPWADVVKVATPDLAFQG